MVKIRGLMMVLGMLALSAMALLSQPASAAAVADPATPMFERVVFMPAPDFMSVPPAKTPVCSAPKISCESFCFRCRAGRNSCMRDCRDRGNPCVSPC